MGAEITEHADREAALDELWLLRDVVSETDLDTAAQLHAVYNRLVVA